MVGKRLPAVMLILLLPLVMSRADQVDDILFQVDQAVENESYTRAISLLEEGKAAYPEESRFPRRAGDLYLTRNLYRIALAEYRRAEELAPGDLSVRWDIVQALGYLGRNEEAVETLENLLDQLPPDSDRSEGRTLRDSTIDDLSWLYFKIDRYDEGIVLLERELAFHFDGYWAHTLGTLYSGKYNLEESRKWYQRSIDEALDNGDSLFASIACYNLSLLEFTFYRYEDARERAQQSLELRDRSGGHLVVGELDFMAWNLPDALDAYHNAESRDETPLARMDLAEFHIRTGYLDEGLRYLEEAEGSGDEGWMYRFGLDITQFGMDLGEMRRDAYAGKAAVSGLTPRAGVKARLTGLLQRLQWTARSLYEDRRYRALTDSHVRSLSEKGNELDAAWYSAMAHSGYSRQALRYLEEARELETVFAPAAESWYLMEMGVEGRNPEKLAAALDGFGPLEGDPVEKSLRELALLGSRRRPTLETRTALASLYRINPGGLRQYDLSLPVAVVGSGDFPSAVSRRIRSLLRRSGYRIEDAADPVPGLSVLRIYSGEDGRMHWYMEDPDGITRAGAETGVVSRRRDLAEILRGLLDGFYATPLGRSSG